MIEREQKFFALPKRDRILYLTRMGFNTPRFITTISEIKELAVFFKEYREKKVSIRSQNLYKDVLLPHYPNVTIDKNLFKKLETHIRKRNDLLIFEAINPKDAVRRGNFWINKSEGKCGIEYKDTPGTVRDLDKETELLNVEMIIEDLLKKGIEGNIFLGYSPSKFIGLPFSQFILEFSVYSYPIGVQQKPEIFWEIRQL